MMPHHVNHDYTIVGISRTEKYLCIVGLLTGGVTLGYFFKRILEWLNRIEIFSDDSKLSFIAKLTNTLHASFGGWATLLFMIIGLLVGLYFVFILLKESPTVFVSEHSVEIKNHIETLTYPFAEVKDIYFDEAELVIVSVSGDEMLRKSYEINKDDLTNALQDYNYPYHHEDPYKELFHLWSPYIDELSPVQNALLKARDLAKKHEDHEEVDKLVGELSRLNIVVKDKGKKQYWRLAVA